MAIHTTRNDLLPGIQRGRRTHLLCVQDVATAIGVSKPTVVRWVAEKGRGKDVLWLPAPDFEIGGTMWAWHPTSIEPVIVEMRHKKETVREREAKRVAAARRAAKERAAWLAAGFELDTDEPPTGLVEIPI